MVDTPPILPHPVKRKSKGSHNLFTYLDKSHGSGWLNLLLTSGKYNWLHKQQSMKQCIVGREAERPT